MINVSKEFKDLLRKGTKIVNYADITLKDGTVLNLGPSDFSIGGFSMSDKTTNGKFEIGTAIAKNISVTIANHTNKFSAYDFYKAIIYMYVAIEKEDGTVLKERKGKYYVINPTSPGDTIKLSGVDSMYLFDKPYNPKKAFPATLQSILADCCTDCGVNIGFGEFDNWNFTVMNAPEECTYRQVISWVAQIAGCNARINNNDYLELVWYDIASLNRLNIDGGNYFVYENENVIDGGDFTNYDSDIVIDGGNFTDYYPPNVTKIKPPTVSTDNVVITGIKVEYNKKEVVSGTEDYLISVKDNPFVADKEDEVCQYLADRLIGLSFRPLSCQMVNNPLFEPFDSCYVYDRKGNAYFTLINDVTYTISGFTTISCKAEDPVRNESSYVSESAKAIVQAKRETANQLSVYDQAVQNMNLLAANSMGLYRESEIQSDGSFIYYMSNRPIAKDENGICIFEEDSVVYKMTGDGFFVSEDGGITYTSGFDSEGNAIVNVLSAIGITFDWAKGGTLSLGGFDNLNGIINIFNKNGINVGTIDNAGISLYSPTTKLQILLSPDVGLIQRDANGNEYNGLIFDETIYLPKAYEPYPGYIQTLRYVGHDFDTMKASTYETKTLESGITQHRAKLYYTHESAEWSESYSYLGTPTSFTMQMPEIFKGKEWVVRVINDGLDEEVRDNTDYKYTWSYDEEFPDCKEDLTKITDWYTGSSALSPMIYDEYEEFSQKKGKTTPYLKLPEPSSGILDFDKYKLNEITDYSLSYEIDSENNTLTITGFAKCGSYWINELMKVRVIVAC